MLEKHSSFPEGYQKGYPTRSGVYQIAIGSPSGLWWTHKYPSYISIDEASGTTYHYDMMPTFEGLPQLPPGLAISEIPEGYGAYLSKVDPLSATHDFLFGYISLKEEQ